LITGRFRPEEGCPPAAWFARPSKCCQPKMGVCMTRVKASPAQIAAAVLCGVSSAVGARSIRDSPGAHFCRIQAPRASLGCIRPHLVAATCLRAWQENSRSDIALYGLRPTSDARCAARLRAFRSKSCLAVGQRGVFVTPTLAAEVLATLKPSLSQERGSVAELISAPPRDSPVVSQ
jgi:hypothetical protein